MVVPIQIEARADRGDNELRDLADPIAKSALVARLRSITASTFSVTVRGCGGHISSHRYTVSIAPAQTAHSVSLKWQPSPTAVSYDLYRSTFSGGPYELVASAILGTSFVDQSVTAGETYFYVAMAWDGTKESGFSNQVIAVVP